MLSLGEDVAVEFEGLQADRSTRDSDYRDLSDYVALARGNFGGPPTNNTDQIGQRAARKVFDATAVEASSNLASVISGVMNSQALPWFNLDLPAQQRRLMKDVQGVREWLQELRDVLLDTVFNAPHVGFHAAADEVFLDITGLGNGFMYVPDGIFDGDIFQALTLAECYRVTDAQGRTIGLYRDYMLRSREAYGFFGNSLPANVVTQALTPGQGGEQHEFLHAVRPRRRRAGPAGLVGQMAWESVYLHRDTKQVLRVGGFPEFPFMTPRWRRKSGERDGRAIGDDVMPAIKLVNKQKQTTLRGAQTLVNPPTQMPDDGFIDPVADLRPGGTNVFRAGTPVSDRISPILSGARPDIGVEMMSLEHRAIRDAYYRDILNTPINDRMTATEVLQRREEALRVLAPAVGRIQMEFHGPVIDRVLAIGIRRSALAWARGRDGVLPLPPPALLAIGADIRPSFVSPVSVAQRVLELENVDRVIGMVERLLPYDPDIGRILDGPTIVRRTQEGQGAWADMLVDPAEYQAEVEAAQEAASQAAGLEAAGQTADTAKTIAEARAA